MAVQPAAVARRRRAKPGLRLRWFAPILLAVLCATAQAQAPGPGYTYPPGYGPMGKLGPSEPATPPKPGPQIKPDDLQGKNIQTAANFIRQMGNEALAANIEAFLKKGYFYRRSFPKDDFKLGNTTAFNNIELDPDAVGSELSFEGRALQTIQLAAVLTHEKRHAHQTTWTRLSESNAENDAWTTEILEVDDWIHVLYMKYLKDPTKVNKQWVETAVDYKLGVLHEYISDRKCWGFGCDPWTTLQGVILNLKRNLQEAKVDAGEPKRVGMIFDQAQKDEQYAARGAGQAPPSGCWLNVTGGAAAPPETYAPEGAVFDNPRDARVADRGSLAFVRLGDGSWLNLTSGQAVPANLIAPAGATFTDANRETAVLGDQRFTRSDCSAFLGGASAGRAGPVVGVALDTRPPDHGMVAGVRLDTHAMSPLESAVLDEINFVRAHPQAFADQLRRGPRSAAADDAIGFLVQQPPLAPVAPNPRLAMAASGHAADQGPRGADSHTGSDGSTAGQRMTRAGVYSMIYAEEISVGYPTAQGVVTQLILDIPGPAHPHRKDLFDPMLKDAGVGCGPNKTYGEMCVIDLSSGSISP